MMILITGHNVGDQRRRADLACVHVRRLALLKEVEGVIGKIKDKMRFCGKERRTCLKGITEWSSMFQIPPGAEWLGTVLTRHHYLFQ